MLQYKNYVSRAMYVSLATIRIIGWGWRLSLVRKVTAPQPFYLFDQILGKREQTVLNEFLKNEIYMYNYTQKIHDVNKIKKQIVL